MRTFDFSNEQDKANNEEVEKMNAEQYNEKRYFDYLNREKTENPWEEKDFSSAFMYL